MTKAEYKEYLKSPHWQATRKKALKHYDNQCTICGSKVKLNVHHFTYENIGNESIHELTVVCEGCHRLLHNIKV